MSGKNTNEGVVLDTTLTVRTIKYYSVIGAGLGLLGIILLLQFGASEQDGAIIGGLLTVVILVFAVLSGPLIAAFVGYANANSGLGDVRARTVNSGIANGIGFAIFGVIVTVILLGGLALLSSGDGGVASGTSGGSGPVEITNLVTLIVLMTIPNSIVGGGITFFLGRRDGTSPQ